MRVRHPIMLLAHKVSNFNYVQKNHLIFGPQLDSLLQPQCTLRCNSSLSYLVCLMSDADLLIGTALTALKDSPQDIVNGRQKGLVGGSTGAPFTSR